MIPNKVSFTGFEVEDPYSVILAQEQNKPCFLPLDWTLVIEPVDKNGKDALDDVNMHQWFHLNCCHRWDFEVDAIGRRVFAFEDDGEATLFRMKF